MDKLGIWLRMDVWDALAEWGMFSVFGSESFELTDPITFK
jgi:hypothetical protein